MNDKFKMTSKSKNNSQQVKENRQVFKTSADKDKQIKEICPHCKMEIAIRNPSGYCDHLYYPDSCKICEIIMKKDRQNKMPESVSEAINIPTTENILNVYKDGRQQARAETIKEFIEYCEFLLSNRLHPEYSIKDLRKEIEREIIELKQQLKNLEKS